MIKEINFKNYRSFLHETKVPFSPFTLVIGPNGAGKSNLLKLIRDAITQVSIAAGQRHNNALDGPQNILVKFDNGEYFEFNGANFTQKSAGLRRISLEGFVALYSFDPRVAGLSENILPSATIQCNGSGIVSVLDSLKTGEREDLFNQIEKRLKKYIPSIRKLSTKTSKAGQKILQVSEVNVDGTLPVSELSEGTQLILTILTTIYQENPPKVMLFEDIDRGLHPRLFQQIVEMLRSEAKSRDLKIFATTHNPYLVDEFIDDEDSVLIVEKEEGSSKITTLAEKMSTPTGEEDSLGALWYGGFYGGVPKIQ